MAIIRQRRENNFSIINNDILNDTRLTFKARGLLVYMLSMKNNWKFYTSELEQHSEKDGREAIQNALTEIEQAGYLKRIQKREKNGKFGSQDWLLLDTPTLSPQTGFPETAKPQTVKPETANPQLTNTNSNKNLNKQELNKDSQAKARHPYHEDYEEIISYLNKKTGHNYQASTPKYRQLINARFKQHATVDDFKTVIDKKFDEWNNDPKMSVYLRPTTLFGTKFNDYLEQDPVTKTATGQFKKVKQGTDWEKKRQELESKKTKEVIKNDVIVDPFVKDKEAEKLRNFFKNLEDETGLTNETRH